MSFHAVQRRLGCTPDAPRFASKCQKNFSFRGKFQIATLGLNVRSSSDRSGSTSTQHGAGAGQRKAVHSNVRRILLTSGLMGLIGTSDIGLFSTNPSKAFAEKAVIRINETPDQTSYDPNDEELLDAFRSYQNALAVSDVGAEEAIWTEIINKYQGLDRPWVPDVVGRALGNRGNARSRQGRMEEALDDYNRAIALAPWSGDPVLNRGVVYESLGRYEDAIADYEAVLVAQPEDPAGWNNLGSALAGMGRWEEAAEKFRRATLLSPLFAFAAANEAVTLYQLGETDRAIREMRNLLRKFPTFPDMRAALTAALWAEGLEGQAELQWARVDDPRYKDRRWLREKRHWPPRLITALEAFLDLKSIS